MEIAAALELENIRALTRTVSQRAARIASFLHRPFKREFPLDILRMILEMAADHIPTAVNLVLVAKRVQSW